MKGSTYTYSIHSTSTQVLALTVCFCKIPTVRTYQKCPVSKFQRHVQLHKQYHTNLITRTICTNNCKIKQIILYVRNQLNNLVTILRLCAFLKLLFVIAISYSGISRCNIQFLPHSIITFYLWNFISNMLLKAIGPITTNNLQLQIINSPTPRLNQRYNGTIWYVD